MGAVKDVFEKLWSGEASVDDHHPLAGAGDLEEIAERSVFYRSFANVTGFETDDGLVLVDTGGYFNQQQTHQALRRWSSARLHTAVFTHGHVDHVFGVPPFAEECKERGWPAPSVIAHEAMPDRFRRYVLTAGWNGIINFRQFGADLFARREPGTRPPRSLPWPTDYTYPNLTYSTALTLVIGGEHFELHHARGETDDHTWVWAPERRVLCPGDLFIWAVPNAGNPQKVQRYLRTGQACADGRASGRVLRPATGSSFGARAGSTGPQRHGRVPGIAARPDGGPHEPGGLPRYRHS
jgi:glyoxylase-like metal-dependent hydrolase (beta-lactamase superfamily II)